MECTIREIDEIRETRGEHPTPVPPRPSVAELMFLPRDVFERRIQAELTPEVRAEMRRQLG